ncbi:MAG: FliI/YscN family ATPase [Pseudomonadota bacterium]
MLDADPVRKGPFDTALEQLEAGLSGQNFHSVIGRLTNVSGAGLQTTLTDVSIGQVCRLRDPHTRRTIQSQVIGIDNGCAILAPFDDVDGLSPETEVLPEREPFSFWISDDVLGSVLDGLGRPIDQSVLDRPDDPSRKRCEINSQAPSLLKRRLVDTPLETGTKVIDGCLTLGEGQRLAIFGAPGSGKTSLLGSLARNSSADVCVLALIGERGRELGEFLERQLPADLRSNCVIVASTSDRPAMERITGAHVATRIAEHFRDQGKRVLLLFDSMTRYARALREVGLAAGEPAVRRGFTPSVYAELPKLIERCGRTDTGSITAIYTVLTENDDLGDPISDEIRSLTDGHISLSRSLAQKGHFPAIDVLGSISRIMPDLVESEQIELVGRVRELLAKYQEIELLVQVGEYEAGNDRLADEAVERKAALDAFFRQPSDTSVSLAETLDEMRAALGWGEVEYQ